MHQILPEHLFCAEHHGFKEDVRQSCPQATPQLEERWSTECRDMWRVLQRLDQGALGAHERVA